MPLRSGNRLRVLLPSFLRLRFLFHLPANLIEPDIIENLDKLTQEPVGRQSCSVGLRQPDDHDRKSVFHDVHHGVAAVRSLSGHRAILL